MFFLSILGGIGFYYSMTTSINDGLPGYIRRSDMGIIDLFYRLIRGVGFVCICLTLYLPAMLLGLFILGIAWGIKKIARKCFYHDYLH